ncbi:hypothetical protein Metfor_2511 [Methanoregula formicica SMSP]|uniref:Uncharacterized protein n=2 Tax=Methanoregula formicica TaxID=882104 RepID=L0HHI9_METFS|nr:hypothetical protein Metfor_2511 [Methanoregula formicica SMSP]
MNIHAGIFEYGLIFGLEHSQKTMVPIIIALNPRTIPYQGIEHHCSVHEIVIRCNSPADITQSLLLGCWNNPVPRLYPFTVPAIRASAVHGEISIGTGNSHAVFFLITLEWQ